MSHETHPRGGGGDDDGGDGVNTELDAATDRNGRWQEIKINRERVLFERFA